MMGMRWQARPGMNLIEVLVAAVVAGVVMLALGGYITANLSGNAKEKDRTLAMQKALQMLEEMSTEDLAANALGPDKYAQEGFSYRLSIQNVVPHAPLSGNIKRNAVYKFVRMIESAATGGDQFSRKVTVKVWYQDGTKTTPMPLGQPLAVVSGVLRSNVARVGSKQVIDLYVISIENVPHLFRNDKNQVSPSATDARASFEKSLTTLQTSNPGLEFRVKYISRLSVGRDAFYRPYFTEERPMTGSGRDTLDWLYFYPGKFYNGFAQRYYDYAAVRGNKVVDTPGTGTTVMPPTSAPSYPLADQYNHAVRYHQEFTDSVTPVAVPVLNVTYPANESPLSLRQFLEDLLQDTSGKYRNAVLVNLHGDMFPGIPLRNYADAAKDLTDTSASASKRRVVTHPYKLNFPATDTVKLLVHGYTSDGSNEEPAYPAHAKKVKVVLKDVWDYLEGVGGTDPAGPDLGDVTASVYERFIAGPNSRWQPTGPAPTKTKVGNDIELEFTSMTYDSRMSEQGGNWTGIKSDSLNDYGLYKLQYFPDPFLAFLDSNQGSSWKPRNTAKFIIEFKLKPLATRWHYQVVTKLAKFAAAPVYEPDDSNDPSVSKTWFYHNRLWNPTRRAYNDIPLTDQVQLIGDPRHNPYLDVRKRILYNRYWTNFTAGEQVYKDIHSSSSSYDKYLNAADVNVNAEFTAADDADSGAGFAYRASYPETADSWNKVKYDMPAYLAIWREALLRNNMMFVNMSGQPLGFIGQGGEFAFAGSTKVLDNTARISKKPWDPGSTSDADDEADELFRSNSTFPEEYDDDWGAIPWIGELYPAHRGIYWAANGNLPIGTGATEFKRRVPSMNRQWDQFADTEDGDDNRRGFQGEDAFAMLLNGLKSGSATPFNVVVGGNGDRGALDTAGTTAFQRLRITVPSQPKSPFAYKLDGNPVPTAWGSAPYDVHGTLDWLLANPNPGAYYKAKNTGEYGVYPVMLTGNGTTGDARRAYFLANAFRPENTVDLGNIMKIGAASIAATYFDATRNSLGQYNIKPQPRARLTKPVTGSTVTGGSVPLEWFARYIRSDGQEYSAYGPNYDPGQLPAAGGPLDLVYFVKYRNQTTSGPWTTADITFSGGTSTSVDADANPTVAPGLVTVATGVVPIPNTPLVTGSIPYHKVTATWNTSSLTDGDYLLRVEAYRKGSEIIPIHYAYHEIPVKVDN